MTRYEAEDGVNHAIAPRGHRHAGFGGWGYVAGWNTDGQWVDFHVTVPAAGAYHVALRYAAGAGDAATPRLCQRRERSSPPSRSRPPASWDTWATATATAHLAPAGATTVSVISNSGDGSKSFLNLDWIDVSPNGAAQRDAK